MKYLSKKALLLYIILISFLIGRVFIVNFGIAKYTNFLNPLFWIFMTIASYLMVRDESNIRMRNKVDIIQSVIIVIILYCMIYFSLGLVFGYERSPFLHTFTVILKNIWAFVVIIFFQEYARFQMIRLSPKSIGYYGIITLLFIVVDIEFWSFSTHLVDNVEFFKYMSQTIIPLIVSNCLFTYLAITSGYISSTIYRGVLALMVYLLPIYPSINWLVASMMKIILVIIVALYVNYADMKSSRAITKRQLKKESLVSYIPYVVLLVVVVCFVGGLFKYQPIAVLSDSMVPEFARGDAVIVEKIGKEDLKKLKKGTILYFSKDGKLIIHRIVSIKEESNGKIEVTTKGDNNNSNDNWVVTNDEIIGVGKFMIPYVGYPSVIVNELLKK